MPDSDNSKAIYAKMKAFPTLESPDLRGPRVYDLSFVPSLNGDDPIENKLPGVEEESDEGGADSV